jgi:hypothetical protein
MSKVETMQKVAEMVGLEFDYVLDAATYFNTLDEAFNWIYLSEDNPKRPFTDLDLIKALASVTLEKMQEVHANTPAEYMVLIHDHTYITDTGIAYLSITR